MAAAPPYRFNLFRGLLAGACEYDASPIAAGLGARIIDNVLVTDSGAELLSTYPLDLLVVD